NRVINEPLLKVLVEGELGLQLVPQVAAFLGTRGLDLLERGLRLDVHLAENVQCVHLEPPWGARVPSPGCAAPTAPGCWGTGFALAFAEPTWRRLQRDPRSLTADCSAVASLAET